VGKTAALAAIEERKVMDNEAKRAAALGVLAQAIVGYLAVTTAEGPYVVPVSFAHDAQHVYWHGGAGKKSRALEQTPQACLTASVLGEFVTAASPCDDNFNYRSAVVSGPVHLVRDEEARETALRSIVAKYDPERLDSPFTPGAFARTLIHAMDIEEITYKQYPRK
jgi:nitroimidazol reductase NimA-like FMN-containing flavoprotein (pyridoxamine 5'-phosphate oxidase superfamily)